MDAIPQITSQVMNSVFLQYWKKMEALRVLQARKMWDWWVNDKDALTGKPLKDVTGSTIVTQAYLRNALMKTFSEDTLDKMNLRVINIVERVVDKIAQVYKQPATRSLDGGVTTTMADGKPLKEQPDSDIVYQGLLEDSSINTKSKLWHKLGKYFNTVLVQPRWMEDTDHPDNPQFEPYLDFVIHTPAWTVVDVTTWDHLRPLSFYYPIWQIQQDKLVQVLVYWSASDHYIVDRLGNRLAMEGNEEKKNPYGKLPIAVLRFKEGTDFWGEGMWDLVEGNEEICCQLINLAYTNIFQCHGQAVGINTGLEGKVSMGPDRPIMIKNAGGPEQQPSSFEFKHPQPEMQQVRETIDWMIKTIQASYGLSPNMFSTDVKIASGTAKMMDNADLNESRVDDQQILEDFEYDLFQVTRMVWNYHNPTNKINDEAEFSISFGEPEVVRTVDEEIKEQEFGLKNGTMSRIEIIRKKNPELSLEEAQVRLDEIMAENRSWEDKYGIMQPFENKQQNNQPPPSKALNSQGE